MKNEFIKRLKRLIWETTPYIYPETRDSYIPITDTAVKIESSFAKNFLVYQKTIQKLNDLDLKGLEWTYNNLADEYSKEIMLKVVVYNLNNDVKVRLPLWYDCNIAKINEITERMKIDDEEINLWMNIIRLKKYDLKNIGYNIKLWFSPMGIFIDFIKEQYCYKEIVSVKKDDIVIDAGACYGDTALYFVERGAKKVYSFEFLEENVGIFHKNMELNPHYKDKIELHLNPISDKSGEMLYAIGNGPGTSVSAEYSEGAIAYENISIDDFVEKNNVEKIDFIKMDIECSEAPALKGAIKTIRKFKPKLAICVYHKKDDLWTIPQLIKEILPEYKLYLDHHTINFRETVLYATVE